MSDETQPPGEPDPPAGDSSLLEALLRLHAAPTNQAPYETEDRPLASPIAGRMAAQASPSAEPAPDPFGQPPGPPVAVAAPAAPPPPPPRELYPTRLEIDYPGDLSRWKTALRLILLIPPYLFFQLLVYPAFATVLAARLPLFAKRKYPTWMFSFNAGFVGFGARTTAYVLLLTDRYPSFDQESSPVRIEIEPPIQGRMSRWRGIIWRFLLLLPHFVVLSALLMAVFVVTIIAWFAILFTGRYPRGMFGFVTGVMRWWTRVYSYLLCLNDRYPPYALSAESGPASNTAAIASGIGGWAFACVVAAAAVTAIALKQDVRNEDIDYAALLAGRGSNSVIIYHGIDDEDSLTLTLRRAYDPGDDLVQILQASGGERYIVFEWELRNRGVENAGFDTSDVWLWVPDEDGEGTRRIDPELVTVTDRAAPAVLPEFGLSLMRAVFLVPDGDDPVELRIDPSFEGKKGIRYRFD